MNPQQVEIAENLETSLAKAIEACEHDRLFVLTDDTTRELCWPVVSGFACLQGQPSATVAQPGELDMRQGKQGYERE